MKLFECLILQKTFYFISLFFLIKCQNNAYDCSKCDISDNNKCYCQSDNENCQCYENCRPDLYTGKCYYCSYERSNFLYPYKISREKCSVLNSATDCNNLLTFENNQCVESCGDGFQLGDYCFKECYSDLGFETIRYEDNKCKISPRFSFKYI